MQCKGKGVMYYPEEECDKLIARIRRICKEKGVSNYALAKRSHVSSSTIHAILSGKSRPQVYTLLQMCNALEVTMEEVFAGGDDESVLVAQVVEDPEEEAPVCEVSRCEWEMLEHYRRLPEEKKEWVRACVEALEG